MFGSLAVRTVFLTLTLAALQVGCSGNDVAAETSASNLDRTDGLFERPSGCSNFFETIKTEIVYDEATPVPHEPLRDSTGKAMYSRVHAQWTCYSDDGKTASLPLSHFGFYFPQGTVKAEPKDIDWLILNSTGYRDVNGAWVVYPRPQQVLIENQFYGISIRKCTPNAATVKLEGELETKFEQARAAKKTPSELEALKRVLRETLRQHIDKAQFVDCKP
jgi:hypothetical protein